MIEDGLIILVPALLLIGGWLLRGVAHNLEWFIALASFLARHGVSPLPHCCGSWGKPGSSGRGQGKDASPKLKRGLCLDNSESPPRMYMPLLY